MRLISSIIILTTAVLPLMVSSVCADQPSVPPAVYLGDLKLRPPRAYGFPRDRVQVNKADISLDSIGLAFWMPDLLPLEGDAFFTPSSRPAEKGRPHPGPEEYVVKVRTLSRTKEYESHGRSSPSQQIENLKRTLGSYDIVQDQGISRLVPTGSSKLGMATWFSLSDPKTTFTTGCILEGEAPNPGCSVSLYLDDWDLSAFVSIPADARYEIPKIAAGLRSLLSRWVEKN